MKQPFLKDYCKKNTIIDNTKESRYNAFLKACTIAGIIYITITILKIIGA